MSNKQLAIGEETILTESLNFANCQKNVPKYDIISGTEDSVRKRPQKRELKLKVIYPKIQLMQFNN